MTDNPATALPDKEYLFKVLRRGYKQFLLSFLIVACFGALATYRARDYYKSSIVVLFDRGGTYTGLGHDSLEYLTETLENSFIMRMRDPDFLIPLEDTLKLKSQSRLRSWLREMKLVNEETNTQRRARLDGWFQTRLIPKVEWGSGVLTLDVRLDDTPEKSQELAMSAMHNFVLSELDGIAARIDFKIELLNKAIAETRRELIEVPGNENGGSPQDQGKKNPALSEDDSLNLRELEAKLLDRIKLAEVEISRLNNDRSMRLLALESEYQRLSARLTPSNPELNLKLREIQKFKETPNLEGDVIQNLAGLRRQLWLTRSQMMYPGVGEFSSMGVLTQKEKNKLERLADYLEKQEALMLERSNIDQQRVDPGKRTIFRTVKPASFDITPIKKGRMQTGLASIFLAFSMGLFTLIWREMRSPLARDEWRVMRSTQIPVIAQLASSSIKEYPKVTPEIADELREALLSKEGSNVKGIRTMLAYRRLELSVNKQCQGKIICLANSGEEDKMKSFILSFCNIITTDQNLSTILVDFSTIDQFTTADKGNGKDLIDALIDPIYLNDAIFAKNDKRPFAFLGITKPLIDQRTRAIKKLALEGLLNTLTTNFDLILIRAMPERMFIENNIIVEAASDLLLLVDALSTTYAELSRTILHLGKDKLRGIVLVGS